MEGFSYFTFTGSFYYPLTFPKDMTSLEGTSGFSGLTCNLSSQTGLLKSLYSFNNQSQLSFQHNKLFILFFNSSAAKSLQSCLTLCNPIDGSPPGSPIPGILNSSARDSQIIRQKFQLPINWNCVVFFGTINQQIPELWRIENKQNHEQCNFQFFDAGTNFYILLEMQS